MDNKTVTRDNSMTTVILDGADNAVKYNVYVVTHPGTVRDHNEDNFAVNDVYRKLEDSEKSLKAMAVEEPMIASVFDGMGGESNGDLASEICGQVAAKTYEQLFGFEPLSIDDLIGDMVVRANDGIIRMLDSNKSKRGGSTCVTTVFFEGYVYPYSLGDSRIYLYHDRVLTQISIDQTLAMKKLRANIFTEEEALTSPDRHKLTSFVGVDADGEGLAPQVYRPFVLRPGDKLLLCSDGLYDMCMDDQIASLLENDSPKACIALTEAALENGGEDNVTCMVIERA